MDAIVYLKSEHSKFRKKLALISKMPNEKTRNAAFDAFCKDLNAHEKVEQKVWYPALRKDPDLRDMIKHLISEEKEAAKAIQTLKKTTFNLIWKLRFAKFKHDVNHHAKSEEQELFPKARKFLNKAELNTLGMKMQKLKASLK